jgi:hypothetical protein
MKTFTQKQIDDVFTSINKKAIDSVKDNMSNLDVVRGIATAMSMVCKEFEDTLGVSVEVEGFEEDINRLIDSL